MSDYAIEMLGITKEFPGVRALSDVTVRVKPGHVHALIGENGAGKSTLMKILSGVYASSGYVGEISLGGKIVRLHSPHDAQKQGIGYVPQEINVIDALTVAENIFVGRTGVGGLPFVNFRALYRRADEFLRDRNIPLNARAHVTSLTAGQRQLVMIARALSMDPSVLILDESTASLTLTETANLFRIVRHLQSRGVTTLFISHKLNEISELADRVTVLRDGAVVAHFDRGAYVEDDIITAMVGRRIQNLYPIRETPIGSEEVLSVENLCVPHPHLANRFIVEDVSFALRKGEILGLAGLVGSGRSEVLNALYGRHPHTGQTFVDGKPVRIRSPRDAKRAGLGLLTEERKQDGLLFNFAIRENISINNLPAISAFNTFLKGDAEAKLANQYMHALGIRAPSIATMVANLSGGNQQKVVFAKVLAAHPTILFLDEPTKGVDVGAKAEIYRMMIGLVRQGISLVVVSSELPELLAMCDRFIVLCRGRMTDTFTKSEANENRVMLAATGTQVKPVQMAR